MPITVYVSGLAPQYVTILAIVRKNSEQFPAPDQGEDISNPLAAIEFCVLYTRLSREDDKSHSPETQLFRTEELATGQGWTILARFTQDADQPISGKAFEARPGWEALTKYLQNLPDKTRRKTCVLVKSFDRFSRNLEEGLATERVFRETLGTRLRSADMLYTAPETDEGWMMFVDVLKFAHYERLVIIKRTKDGLATARREGVHLGTFPRYFEKDAEGRIVPSKEAKTVVDLRAGGTSYSQIAEQTGVTRQEAFSICKYLANELRRLSKEKASNTASP